MKASAQGGGWERAVPAILFAAVFAVYLGSRNTQIWDSQYTMLLSQTIWTRGTFELTPYFETAEPLPYQIAEEQGRLYYGYPPGTSILAVPYVAVANAFGLSATDEAGRPYRSGERKLQRPLAAAVTAGTVVFLFATARLLLPLTPSLVIAVAAAFGTQLWSTASRAMWAHTFSLLFISWILYLLVRWEVWQRRPNSALVGSLLSWLFFVRPTNAVFIVAVSVYLAWRERRTASLVVAAGACWLAAFLLWSHSVFGTWLPAYYHTGGHIDHRGFFSGLNGILWSPSRGLLVYTPAALVGVALCVRYWKWRVHTGLWMLAAAATLAFIAVIAAWPVWWGGHCYGPRLTSEVVPWLALLAMLGEQARRRFQADRPNEAAAGVPIRWLGSAVAGTLVAYSVAVHGIGANSSASAEWNSRILTDADNQEVLWDWSQAQFLANLEKTRR